MRVTGKKDEIYGNESRRIEHAHKHARITGDVTGRRCIYLLDGRLLFDLLRAEDCSIW